MGIPTTTLTVHPFDTFQLQPEVIDLMHAPRFQLISSCSWYCQHGVGALSAAHLVSTET